MLINKKKNTRVVIKLLTVLRKSREKFFQKFKKILKYFLKFEKII